MGIRLALLTLPLIALAGCETTQPEKKYYLSSYRGMEEKPGVLGSPAMIREADADRLERYTKVVIEDVKVIRSKNTNPKVKQATREEAERLAERFEVILAEELGRSFEVTRYRGSNTLLVRAAITELQPSNPALFAVNYLPYAGVAATGLKMASPEKNTIGAGSTTIEIEVLDARSRRQLYAMVDRLKGSKLQPGGLEKWGQTEGAMRIWARQVHRGVKARTSSSLRIGGAASAQERTASRRSVERSSRTRSDGDREARRLFPRAARAED